MERKFEVNWQPLLLLLEEESVHNFMFMGSVIARPEGPEVFLYKHKINRGSFQKTDYKVR